MVDSKNRSFLVIGSDFFSRQSAIESIKKKISRQGCPALNTVVIYGEQIEPAVFQEKVLTVSFDGDKIIILKNAQELPAAAKDFLLNNFPKTIQANYFIFEIDEDVSFLYDKKSSADKFLSFIQKNAAIFKAVSAAKETTMISG